jgi:hypothetical protein
MSGFQEDIRTAAGGPMALYNRLRAPERVKPPRSRPAPEQACPPCPEG